MKTTFFFFLTMLLMSSVGAFAQSETNTPLEGDLNHDGEVNAADVVVLVDIIMKKNVDSNKYYWYIGTENPASISNIQSDNTVGGWHEIGTSLSGFVLDTDANPVHISEERAPYYVIIPNGLHIYDGLGTNIEELAFDEVTCNITGYKAFKWSAEKDGGGFDGVRNVTGVIIKSNDNIDSNKYYWYIGVDNPSSISNIQTDNTVGGWHEIGSSLSGFVLDTNDNPVHISETRVPYYVVIPNELDIYDSFGDNGEYMFTTLTCNIPGYKAFRYIPDEDFPDGVRDVTGVIIKSNDNIDSNKYYWYIGVDNPSSISNIQTDNTVGGWHEIGSSLSGFVLDTNDNPVHISETRVPYYVVIPNDLHIYNGLNMNIETVTFETVVCNISGYKAFKYLPSGGSTGVRDVTGVIIK